jgi:endonuclease/exonuclease/phosphatase family metal-dependent hydrolase
MSPRPEPEPDETWEGAIIKGSAPEVYLVQRGRRRWIPNPATLQCFGGWDVVQVIDDSELEGIPGGVPLPSLADGMLIQGTGPKVYLMQGCKRRWVPDPDTLATLGGWERVVSVSERDLQNIAEDFPLPSVVTGPPKVSFRVMSANLWEGARNDPGLTRLACYIGHADMAFLQEVEKGTVSRNRVDQAQELAQKSGLTSFHFAKRKDHEGGDAGIAILSRLPLGEITVHTVPDGEYFNESTLIIEAVITFFSQRIRLFATHYPAGAKADPQLARTIREKATEFMLNRIDQVDGPLIFGGDLNATHEQIEIIRLTAKLNDSWNAAPQEREHCDAGGRRIDYIFFRGPYIIRRYEAPCWPLNEFFLPKYETPTCSLSDADLSDHPFVLVEFEIVGI